MAVEGPNHVVMAGEGPNHLVMAGEGPIHAFVHTQKLVVVRFRRHKPDGRVRARHHRLVSPIHESTIDSRYDLDLALTSRFRYICRR
jgi:hypothetical protein